MRTLTWVLLASILLAVFVHFIAITYDQREGEQVSVNGLAYAKTLAGTDSPRTWRVNGAEIDVNNAHVGIVEMKGSTEVGQTVVLVIPRSHPFFYEWVTLKPNQEITLIVSPNFSPNNRNGWLAESFLAPNLPIVEKYLQENQADGKNP